MTYVLTRLTSEFVDNESDGPMVIGEDHNCLKKKALKG